jgi:hypothetical protein
MVLYFLVSGKVDGRIAHRIACGRGQITQRSRELAAELGGFVRINVQDLGDYSSRKELYEQIAEAL